MELVEIIRRADELNALIDAMRLLDHEQEQRILQKFRLDWNYHSNAVDAANRST